MHYHQLACLLEYQLAIMRAYEVVSMNVSKPYYINMYSSIDEPFKFNISHRHILVTLVLVVNTFSQISLVSLLFLIFSFSSSL